VSHRLRAPKVAGCRIASRPGSIPPKVDFFNRNRFTEAWSSKSHTKGRISTGHPPSPPKTSTPGDQTTSPCHFPSVLIAVWSVFISRSERIVRRDARSANAHNDRPRNSKRSAAVERSGRLRCWASTFDYVGRS